MDQSDIPHVGLDVRIGLRMTALEPDRATAAFEITADLLDETGSLHRGVISAAVETAASMAGAAWYSGRGQVVGVSNTTSHFASVGDGLVDVLAEPVARLDDRQVWTVAVTARGRLLARGNVALANVPDAGRLGSQGGSRPRVTPA